MAYQSLGGHHEHDRGAQYIRKSISTTLQIMRLLPHSLILQQSHFTNTVQGNSWRPVHLGIGPGRKEPDDIQYREVQYFSLLLVVGSSLSHVFI